MKLTVMGDTGNFKAGQILKRDADAVKYYRSIVDGGQETPTPLSDEDILAAIEAIEGDDEDAELQRITLIENGGVNEVFHSVAITAGSHSIAQAAAIAAGKISAETVAEINRVIDAKEITKRGPAAVALDLSHDFTPEEIEAMPVPGSTADKTNNPDRFTEKVNIGGVEKRKPANYYGKLYDNSALGAPLALKIEGIDKASKTTPDADAPKEYLRMSKVEKTAERARLIQRRNTGRQSIITAVKILKQMAAVNKMPNVGVRFFFEDAKADKPVIKNTPACIVLFDKHEQANASAVSVGAFLLMKPETVFTGKLADLTETGSKKKPEQPQGEEARYDLPVLQANVGLMVGYSETLAMNDKLTGNLYALLNSKAGEDFLANIFRLEAWLDTITSKPEYQKLYRQIEADLSAQRRVTKAA